MPRASSRRLASAPAISDVTSFSSAFARASSWSSGGSAPAGQLASARSTSPSRSTDAPANPRRDHRSRLESSPFQGGEDVKAPVPVPPRAAARSRSCRDRAGTGSAARRRRACPVPGHTPRGGDSAPARGPCRRRERGQACWGHGGSLPARGDSMESGLISHADKVLFPERGETKGDLAEYYLGVAEPLMRTMGGRPVLLQRFPEGAAGPSFFQKRVPKNAPGWLQTTTVATPNGTTSQALVAADIDHVLWAVNLGCLGFHVWP